MAFSDWKQIEIFDDAILSHRVLADEVGRLCYDITQIMTLCYRPYGVRSNAKYNDEILEIDCHSLSNNFDHCITVTLKPKGVEVLCVYFDLMSSDRIGYRWAADQRFRLFRVGSWIAHLATFAPKVNQVHANFDGWKQEYKRQQIEASNKQSFGRLD